MKSKLASEIEAAIASWEMSRQGVYEMVARIRALLAAEPEESDQYGLVDHSQCDHDGDPADTAACDMDEAMGLMWDAWRRMKEPSAPPVAEPQPSELERCAHRFAGNLAPCEELEAAHCHAGYPPDTHHRSNAQNGLSGCTLIHSHAFLAPSAQPPAPEQPSGMNNRFCYACGYNNCALHCERRPCSIDCDHMERMHVLGCDEAHLHDGLASDCHSQFCWCRQPSVQPPAPEQPVERECVQTINRMGLHLLTRCHDIHPNLKQRFHNTHDAELCELTGDEGSKNCLHHVPLYADEPARPVPPAQPAAEVKEPERAIRACDWCGDAPRVMRGERGDLTYQYFWVESACGARGPRSTAVLGALVEWNRRAATPSPSVDVKERETVIVQRVHAPCALDVDALATAIRSQFVGADWMNAHAIAAVIRRHLGQDKVS